MSAVRFALALLAVPADEARADPGHPGGSNALYRYVMTRAVLIAAELAAECERLGGDLQDAGGEADRICSGVDWNDTFCIIGSVDAFPCAYFFAHVKECNALNRPALDPWHCAKQCESGLRARGARRQAD